MIELHDVRYFTPEDISKNFPVSLEFINEKIESGELDYCLIDEKKYICEEDMISFFTGKNTDIKA